MNERRRALVAVAALVLLGVLGVALGPRLLTIASGPQNEAVARLKEAERLGFELEVGSARGRLNAQRARYDRISVLRADHDGATLSATLDFEGTLGDTKVSSLGFERLELLPDGFSWKAQSGWAPRLAAIVSSLERRQRAIDRADRAALNELAQAADAGGALGARLEALLSLRNRRYRAVAWFIRSERELVVVREEFRVSGSTPDRPVAEEGVVLLRLVPAEEQFLFVDGLM